MKAYVAAFFAQENGSVGALFPDLPGCLTQGDTLEEALASAQEALSCHLTAMAKLGEAFPPASSLTAARALAETQAIEDGDPLPDDTVYQLVLASPEAHPRRQEAVRISVSLAPQVLSRIDAAALDLGISRSALIALASREYVNRMG